MKTLLKWFLMLSKRLYKKPSFLVILAAIPLCVFALSFAAKQGGGFLTIVLAQEDPKDPISSQVVETLLQDKETLIQFVSADSPEAALKTVNTGGADCAWIFPEDMQGHIAKFVETKSTDDAVVQMVERENTVFTRIALEKLSSLMFKYCAQAEYLRFVRVDAEQLAHVPEEQLLETYESIALSEDLFTFENALGNINTPEVNYLTAPIRGLLAILICLCAAAASAYYLQDRQMGTFSLVKEHMRPLVVFACLMIAVLNIGVVAFIALAFAGLLGNLWLEVAALLLYCVCCAGFWMLLLEVFPDAKWLCATVPILVLAMVAICPVFFHFAFLEQVNHVLPPTYYVNVAHNPWYLLYMPAYTLAALAAAAGLHWIKDRIRRKRMK